MDLADLQTFLAVVQNGSFQRAAAARRVSRSSLRRQVDRLEDELGVQLLRRGAKGTELTEAGGEVLAGASTLMADVSALVDRARTAGGVARGVLRFVVPVGMPIAPRARAIQVLKGLHPELDIELIEDEDPISRIGEPFDLMFHIGDVPARQGWFSQVVARVPLRLQASAAYADEHGVPTTMEELRRHPLLQWTPPGQRDEGLPVKRKGKVKMTPWFRTANISLLTHLAETGAGVVFAPVFPSVSGQGEELLPVLDGVVGGTVTLRALSPRSSRIDPSIRAMLKNARRMLEAAGL